VGAARPLTAPLPGPAARPPPDGAPARVSAGGACNSHAPIPSATMSLSRDSASEGMVWKLYGAMTPIRTPPIAELGFAARAPASTKPLDFVSQPTAGTAVSASLPNSRLEYREVFRSC